MKVVVFSNLNNILPSETAGQTLHWYTAMVSYQRPPVLASSCALRRPVVESAMVTYNQCYAVTKGVLDNVGMRYLFSCYIIDPNKYRFRKVVRIVTLVILFQCY